MNINQKSYHKLTFDQLVRECKNRGFDIDYDTLSGEDLIHLLTENDKNSFITFVPTIVDLLSSAKRALNAYNTRMIIDIQKEIKKILKIYEPDLALNLEFKRKIDTTLNALDIYISNLDDNSTEEIPMDDELENIVKSATYITPKKSKIYKPLVTDIIRLQIESYPAKFDSIVSANKDDPQNTSQLLLQFKSELNAVLQKYNFQGMDPYKISIEKTLTKIAKKIEDISIKINSGPTKNNKIIKPMVDGNKEATRIENRVVYTPTKYKIIDVSNFTLVDGLLKGEEDQVKCITFLELQKEIKSPSFITRITKECQYLMEAKLVTYREKLNIIKKEYDIESVKINAMRRKGMDERTIKDIYPSHDSLLCSTIDIDSLMQLVKNKAQITEDEMRINLDDALNDSENGIISLVGRDSIKNQIASQIYSFSMGHHTFLNSFSNIIIFGDAGVGKTKLAKTIGFVFSKIGVLAKDNVNVITRSDLVGQYIGQTGPRTRSILMNSLESVLFIDEAYQLASKNNDVKDFGSEAITEIVNFLDKFIGLSIVIAAGYKKEMLSTFMSANEGIPRRFPFRYTLDSYSTNELVDILMIDLKKRVFPKNLGIGHQAAIEFDTQILNFIFSLIDHLGKQIPNLFNNQAGDMLNLSSSILKIINSSYSIRWKNKDFENNKKIIVSGMNDFLSMKLQIF